MLAFDNTEVAFRDKSDKELKKAWWLFRAVGKPAVVKLGSMVLHPALWLGIPVRWAIKPTVFSHFCGGESIDECEPTIKRLYDSNIYTILDYSAEGKETESDLDYTKNQILLTIDKAAGDKRIPFAVFKPSGMARFSLLEKVQAGELLTPDEQQEYNRVGQRFEEICTHAARMDVPVMIDSEESWIQDIVDGMVEELMFRFNTSKPLIYNTLQMYRHDRPGYLKRFITRAREKGIFAAFKLVRGAYMEKERDRARKAGYLSPIYPDKEATDRAFDEATALCLANLDNVAVNIGTHNEISCAKAVDIISGLSVPSDHPHISFAQLLGMSDHISYNLARDGYNVCKYVPYGPVKTVMPYLIRRAQENTSVAGQTSRELFLIRKEIDRRKL